MTRDFLRLWQDRDPRVPELEVTQACPSSSPIEKVKPGRDRPSRQRLTQVTPVVGYSKPFRGTFCVPRIVIVTQRVAERLVP